ncbi:hypothetical protein ACJJTC_016331 [Scirpophaga incertulas]
MALGSSKTKAFDSHKMVYTALAWYGYWELQSESRRAKYVHAIYRVFILSYVIWYNTVQIYNAVTSFVDVDKSVQWPGVDLVLTDLAFVIKLSCFMINTKKLKAINDQIKGPMFHADTRQDEKFIMENYITYRKIFKIINICMTFSVVGWLSYRNFQAWTGRLHAMPELYFSINFDSKLSLAKAIAVQSMRSIWTGFGHVTLDLLIFSYYLQAVHQLRLIKHNMKHLFDSDNTTRQRRYSGRFQYLDETCADIKTRFVYYIRRHQNIVGLINNVNDIFGFGIATHIFFMTFGICFAIYDASAAGIYDPAAAYWGIILLFHLGQTCFFCYFGSLLESESDTLSTSVYSSNWTEVSPKFRRMIVITICNWQTPITVKLCGLLPLSLNTFVSMCRLAYSMFAMLLSVK